RVCPTRTSSPERSTQSDSTRVPLTYVPLRDPRSRTDQPPPNCSRTACSRDTVRSVVTTMSLVGAVPTLARPASSTTSSLPPGRETCTYTAIRALSPRITVGIGRTRDKFESAGGDAHAQGGVRPGRGAVADRLQPLEARPLLLLGWQGRAERRKVGVHD